MSNSRIRLPVISKSRLSRDIPYRINKNLSKNSPSYASSTKSSLKKNSKRPISRRTKSRKNYKRKSCRNKPDGDLIQITKQILQKNNFVSLENFHIEGNEETEEIVENESSSTFITENEEKVLFKKNIIEIKKRQDERRNEIEDYLKGIKNLKDVKSGDKVVDFPENYDEIVSIVSKEKNMSKESLNQYVKASCMKDLNPYEPINDENYLDNGIFKIRKLDLILEQKEKELEQIERSQNLNSEIVKNTGNKKKSEKKQKKLVNKRKRPSTSNQAREDKIKNFVRKRGSFDNTILKFLPKSGSKEKIERIKKVLMEESLNNNVFSLDQDDSKKIEEINKKLKEIGSLSDDKSWKDNKRDDLKKLKNKLKSIDENLKNINRETDGNLHHNVNYKKLYLESKKEIGDQFISQDKIDNLLNSLKEKLEDVE